MVNNKQLLGSVMVFYTEAYTEYILIERFWKDYEWVFGFYTYSGG